MFKRVAAIAALFFAMPAHADWHVAESDHFVVYADDRWQDVQNFGEALERYHAALNVLQLRENTVPSPSNRLTVFVVGSAGKVRKLAGDNANNVAGFYVPRAGASRAFVPSISMSGRETDFSVTVLLHEYAHHFMFNNFGIPAPAWFVEGFAEYVSTTEFKSNGEWIFGYPQKDRAYSVNNGQKIPIEALLTTDVSEIRDGGAFYGWSWALTHMLYSDPKKRGDQIQAYLREINSGTENLEAARRHFGDLAELESNLRRYVRGSMGYSKSDLTLAYAQDIRITDLSSYEGELVELTLERIARYEPEATRDKLRSLAERGEGTAESWYQLAEIEFALNHKEEAGYDFSAAEAAVDRALALDGNHVRANLLKGRLLLEPFDHGDDPDPANWAAAREYIGKANRLDPADPLALYDFANSYLREGASHPQMTDALKMAFSLAPEAAEVRFAYATQLAREGRYDDAIFLLKVLANNPHGDRGAKAVIEALTKARDSGGVASIRFEPSEEEDESTGDE